MCARPINALSEAYRAKAGYFDALELTGDPINDAIVSFLNERKIHLRMRFFMHSGLTLEDKAAHIKRDFFRFSFYTNNERICFLYPQTIYLSDGKGSYKPSLEELVRHILSLNVGKSHEEYCLVNGYDVDSLKIYRRFIGMRLNWEKIDGFFTTKELNELATIIKRGEK